MYKLTHDELTAIADEVIKDLDEKHKDSDEDFSLARNTSICCLGVFIRFIEKYQEKYLDKTSD